MKLNSIVLSPALALLVTGGIAVAVKAGTIRHDRTSTLYENLALDFPSVGYLKTDRMICSGTLIASQWLLTAGHCLYGENTSNNYSFIDNAKFTIGGYIYEARWFEVYSQWIETEGSLNTGYDIGLVKLNLPVSNVNPATLYNGAEEIGELGFYVGFGNEGTGLTGGIPNTTGTKRAGTNVIDRLHPNSNWILEADFDSPTGNNNLISSGRAVPTNLEYSITPGDSGGGMFIGQNNRFYLAGVNSFYTNNSKYGSRFGVTRVSPYINWINSVIANRRQASEELEFNDEPIASIGIETIASESQSPANKNLSNASSSQKVPESSTPFVLMLMSVLFSLFCPLKSEKQ
jgi:Trypsin